MRFEHTWIMAGSGAGKTTLILGDAIEFATRPDPPSIIILDPKGVIYPKLSRLFVPYKVGTCHGIYTVEDGAYKIVAVINDEPGNGHFADVLEWFENIARRDSRDLEVVEIWNDGLRKHLVEKRDFSLKDNGDAVKHFE